MIYETGSNWIRSFLLVLTQKGMGSCPCLQSFDHLDFRVIRFGRIMIITLLMNWVFEEVPQFFERYLFFVSFADQDDRLRPVDPGAQDADHAL